MVKLLKKIRAFISAYVFKWSFAKRIMHICWNCASTKMDVNVLFTHTNKFVWNMWQVYLQLSRLLIASLRNTFLIIMISFNFYSDWFTCFILSLSVILHRTTTFLRYLILIIAILKWAKFKRDGDGDGAAERTLRLLNTYARKVVFISFLFGLSYGFPCKWTQIHIIVCVIAVFSSLCAFLLRKDKTLVFQYLCDDFIFQHQWNGWMQMNISHQCSHKYVQMRDNIDNIQSLLIFYGA